jgi:hypothetical protein
LNTHSARQALDRLDALARSGDAHAAFEFYETADYCSIPSEVYRRMLQSLPIGVFTEARAKLESEAEDHETVCSEAMPSGEDPDALRLLASLYRSGDIVPRNSVQALVYRAAAEEAMRAQPEKYTASELALEREFTKSYADTLAQTAH